MDRPRRKLRADRHVGNTAMKRSLLHFLIIPLAALTASRALAASTATSLVVINATLWTERGAVAGQEILIREGRVAALGASGAIARPADARVIDAAGDTLLPGLIDAHVHLSAPTRLPPEFAANPREHIYATAGKQLLRSGVTGGRIHLWGLNAVADFKRDSADERFPAPRLALAGPGFFGGRPNCSEIFVDISYCSTGAYDTHYRSIFENSNYTFSVSSNIRNPASLL